MSTSPEHDDRIARLESRLLAAEDQLAIGRLLAGYGPALDRGDADAASSLWTDDGEYDVEGWHMRSRDDVRAMVASPQQAALIEGGCTHLLGPARIDVDGDRAVAVCASMLVVNRDGRFVVARSGANRFELARTDAGWRIVRRTVRLLDGSPEAVALLAEA